MVSVKVASFVGAVALFASAAQMAQVAQAADLPQLPPVYAPPIEEYIASGWYLRGDIGMSNQKVKSLDNALYTSDVTVNTVRRTSTARRSSGSASATSSTTGSAPI